ncbi:MAG: oligosaccharide flippase family protein [Phascolarctobacterium faecium]
MTKDVLRGAMILTLAGLMVKIIGSVNRILLSRLLGGEGIGLYQMAYPVYLLMLSVSSAGIPDCDFDHCSRKSGKRRFCQRRQGIRVSLGLMAATGLVFTPGYIVRPAGWSIADWYAIRGLIMDW